jgi:hypothetical protein
VLVALGNDLIGKISSARSHRHDLIDTISMSHFSWLWPSAAWMSVIR